MECDITTSFGAATAPWANRPNLRFIGDTGAGGGDGAKTDPPTDDDDDDDDDDDTPKGDGAAAARALKTERAERKRLAKQLKTLTDAEEARKRANLSESDRIKAEKADVEKRATKAEHRVLMYKVGLDAKLDPSLIERLQGETEEELKADAKVLAERFGGDGNGGGGKRRIPKADPSQGRRGSGSGGLSKQEQFGETLDSLFDRS